MGCAGGGFEGGTKAAVGATCIGGWDELLCAGCVDADALFPPAAATEYRTGGSVAVRGAGGGSPAFRMLDMGCCAKLGFGGGFAVAVAGCYQ